MSIYVVHAGVDLSLELYVSPQLEHAIAIQWERIRDKEVSKTYTKALERRLEELLKDCLDWDLKAPTPAQVSFATLVATRLGIAVPSEALQSRFHMAMFLEKNAAKVRESAIDSTESKGTSDCGALPRCRHPPWCWHRQSPPSVNAILDGNDGVLQVEKEHR